MVLLLPTGLLLIFFFLFSQLRFVLFRDPQKSFLSEGLQTFPDLKVICKYSNCEPNFNRFVNKQAQGRAEQKLEIKSFTYSKSLNFQFGGRRKLILILHFLLPFLLSLSPPSTYLPLLCPFFCLFTLQGASFYMLSSKSGDRSKNKSDEVLKVKIVIKLQFVHPMC